MHCAPPTLSHTLLNCLNRFTRFIKMTFLATKSKKFAKKRKVCNTGCWLACELQHGRVCRLLGTNGRKGLSSKLWLQERFLCILQMYAHNIESQHEAFLEEVEVALVKATSSEFLVLLGDFDAHVGIDNATRKGVTGQHGDPEIYKNGKCLLQFCATNLKLSGVFLSTAVITSAINCCGRKRVGGTKSSEKRSFWWNQDVKEAICVKKSGLIKVWFGGKKYLKNSTNGF